MRTAEDAEDALLAKLQAGADAMRAAGQPVPAVPTWETGPPPLTSVEAYPAVWVLVSDLVGSRPHTEPGWQLLRWRLDVVVYTRDRGAAADGAGAHRDALRLDAALRAVLDSDEQVGETGRYDRASGRVRYARVKIGGTLLVETVLTVDVDAVARLDPADVPTVQSTSPMTTAEE